MSALDTIHAKNAIRICVDAVNAESFHGRLYHRYKPDPIPFEGAEQMLLAAESLFDNWNYPQPGLFARSFFPRPAQRGNKIMDRQPLEDLTDHTGGRATFTVQVVYRQNATWQGTVTWLEKGKQSYFRSALELIKLMDSALEEAPPSGDKPSAAFS
ncbi:hypothetical protein [Bittarella massiliensis (ex Durand et al. 2017)]|uniref:hypothetical protein n=1 Tax=Bittarella massiliensis (ex Durand et al. 2017) TaxID=1720313 RepID=UPI001FB62C84|nr:hypothetical protein [Bittarella massiliensis (ex Durand et al. 2017)]